MHKVGSEILTMEATWSTTHLVFKDVDVMALLCR
jgi:hypothetical protein